MRWAQEIKSPGSKGIDMLPPSVQPDAVVP